MVTNARLRRVVIVFVEQTVCVLSELLTQAEEKLETWTWVAVYDTSRRKPSSRTSREHDNPPFAREVQEMPYFDFYEINRSQRSRRKNWLLTMPFHVKETKNI